MKQSLFILIIATFSQTSFAKTIEVYDSSIKVENINGGQNVDLAGVLGYALGGTGFMCTSSLSQKEVESVPNYKGEDAPLTFSHAGDFAFTAFGQPQSHSEMPVNFQNKNAHMEVGVFQHCSGSKPSTCEDADHHSYYCTEPVSMDFEWDCNIPASSYPRQKQGKDYECHPNNQMGFFNMFTAGPLTSMVMNYLQQKKITVHLQDLRTEEHFMKFGCDPNADVYKLDPALTSLLHFSGGISDTTFQRTIDYKIGINGQQAGEQKRGNGITNFDVLVCNQTPNKGIEVDVDAKDSKSTYPHESVTLDPQNGAAMATMDFKRKGWFKTYNSEVSVTKEPLPHGEGEPLAAPSW